MAKFGDMNFSLNQLYPYATTAPTLAEDSNPEAADQQALVDDQKTTMATTGISTTTKNGIFGALLAIIASALILGFLKEV